MKRDIAIQEVMEPKYKATVAVNTNYYGRSSVKLSRSHSSMKKAEKWICWKIYRAEIMPHELSTTSFDRLSKKEKGAALRAINKISLDIFEHVQYDVDHVCVECGKEYFFCELEWDGDKYWRGYKIRGCRCSCSDLAAITK